MLDNNTLGLYGKESISHRCLATNEVSAVGVLECIAGLCIAYNKCNLINPNDPLFIGSELYT